MGYPALAYAGLLTPVIAISSAAVAVILAVPIEAELEALGLKRHLSANRTQGVPNMISRVREAARRLAA